MDPNRLPESVKASIRDLSSAVATVSGGLTGGSLVNAQIAGVVGQNAVENNALINSKGESKLNAQERKINEKLKKAGVQNADDYQRKYDACKTEQCKKQVLADYEQASKQASQIILELYRSGQLSTEESMILLTSYGSKMMQGAGESQHGWDTPIFNKEVNKWTPSGKIKTPEFEEIRLSNAIQKMKKAGVPDKQIEAIASSYQIAGQYFGSYAQIGEQVDALYNSGLSLKSVINVIALKRGKALSINEIKAITTRYNNKAGSLVTANGQVIKNDGHLSTASESRGATQSGGKGKVEGAEKGNKSGNELTDKTNLKANENKPIVNPATNKAAGEHTIVRSGKAPKTSTPNSIYEVSRADGSRSVTYYDDKGRTFSREDYGQQKTHGQLGYDSNGKVPPHEHKITYNERGYVDKHFYRKLDANGKPVGPWIVDKK
nr:VENN motif pre-toxin domain-containing protein [Snodgrassella communis]